MSHSSPARRAGAEGRRGPAIAATAALCLALAGCNGDADDDDPTPSGEGEPGLTPPGATLDVGETATLPLSDDAAVIDLTVADVERGDVADLDEVGGLEGTPYYVRLEATAVSGDASQFFVETYMSAWSGDERLVPIATPLTVGPCDRTYFGVAADPGTTLETCVTFVVEPGQPAIDRVGFGNDGAYPIDGEDDVEWSGDPVGSA